MEAQLVDLVAAKSGVQRLYVEHLVALYDDKATIPFVSRYRKDQTGNLDEVGVARVYDAIKYFRDLSERKAFVLGEIERKGKLTMELRAAIETCTDARILEDLYLPYKEKRKTKADKAREAGLEPLARMLLAKENLGDAKVLALDFAKAGTDYDTVEKALEGALYIISQQVLESVNLMESFLKSSFSSGVLISKKKRGYNGEDHRFEDYYDFTEALKALCLPRNSHRYLAIRRGAEQGALSMKAEVDEGAHLFALRERFLLRSYYYQEYVEKAIEIAYSQYIRPALETRIQNELSEAAEMEAIKVFARNLDALFMAPPIPYRSVLGMDPGLRTGIKVAVLDRDGTFLDHRVFHILSAGEAKKAKESLVALIKKHSIGAVGVGNGTGSREAMAFVRDAVKEVSHDIIVALVDEAGASVYSASELAREEFPDLDVTVRGAISIGRRLQNPLAELVKIDPKSIGVGQYQHDVDQKKLREALQRVIEICVNHVGVDLNTASHAILTYISGLSDKVARSIVEHRKNHGFYKSRGELLKVKGLGPKAYEQCAGFLRIRGGKNPLDGTGVHPESYGVVEKMAGDCNLSVSALLGNRNVLQALDRSRYLTATCQAHNFDALLDSLLNPGKDPRKEFRTVAFREGIEGIDDVKEEMLFEGRVTNVTNFGAFIDIGVHTDGLCHKSQLAERFVADPSEVVKVGDIVTVKVLAVDYGKRRISLKLLVSEKG
ncbi:MAG: Tex family protein [Candidatus Eremiobacteraeota bacterium]|nr:Tex family protein [Candidatus Eremiobacteraeota bacterium]